MGRTRLGLLELAEARIEQEQRERLSALHQVYFKALWREQEKSWAAVKASIGVMTGAPADAMADCERLYDEAPDDV